jgi:hypothetical protein
MCGKYLSVYGEYWGYLRYTKMSPKCGKYLNIFRHGEDAKRLLAYSPYTPRGIKVCISQLKIYKF